MRLIRGPLLAAEESDRSLRWIRLARGSGDVQGKGPTRLVSTKGACETCRHSGALVGDHPEVVAEKPEERRPRRRGGDRAYQGIRLQRCRIVAPPAAQHVSIRLHDHGIESRSTEKPPQTTLAVLSSVIFPARSVLAEEFQGHRSATEQ